MGLSAIFKGIDPVIGAKLRDEAVIKHVKAGHYLFQQGEPGEYLAVVLSGKFIAVLDKTEPERILGEIHRAEVVGEMSLISEDPRSASVIAISDAYVAVISKHQFNRACQLDVQLLRNVSNQLINRLKRANEGTSGKSSETVIGVVDMVDSTGISENGIYHVVKGSDWFEPNLTAINETKAINDLPAESPDIKTTEYLMSQKEDNKSLFISLNGSDTWRNHAIDLCNCMVFHVLENQVDAYEEWIAKMKLSNLQWKYLTKFLVIQYEGGSQPENVSKWLTHFNPSQVIRYSKDKPKHVDRVIRMITGNANCLTLAGGGAHGFAHLGVLKALKEKGIEIDVVGGSSIGAILAGLVAMDVPYDEVKALSKLKLSDNNPLNDYTLPITAILKGKRMYGGLKSYFNIPIENLWLNYFCVASDYIHCTETVFEHGLLYQRVAASISIPGVLPPQIIDGVYYVDGGVLNNVPVNCMEERYRGKRITVDLSNIKHFTVEDVKMPSPYKVLFSKINPLSKPIKAPKMMSVIMKSITMSSYAKKGETEALSHIYINPRVRHGFLAWKKFDPIVQEGYEVAKKSLEKADLKPFTL